MIKLDYEWQRVEGGTLKLQEPTFIGSCRAFVKMDYRGIYTWFTEHVQWGILGSGEGSLEECLSAAEKSIGSMLAGTYRGSLWELSFRRVGQRSATWEEQACST